MDPCTKRPLYSAARMGRAFSLPELLIVMAVAVIMLTIGIPAIKDYGLEKRLRGTLSQLVADLNFARHKAVESRTSAVVCPRTPAEACSEDGLWQHGWMTFLDHNGDHQRQGDEPIIRASGGDPRVNIRSTASRPQVRFSPAGTAPASNLSIVFCDHRGLASGRKLVVSHSGRIRQTVATSSDEDLCGDEFP